MGAVNMTYYREAGIARGDLHLDVDRHRLDAVECDRRDPRHHVQPRTRPLPVLFIEHSGNFRNLRATFRLYRVVTGERKRTAQSGLARRSRRVRTSKPT